MKRARCLKWLAGIASAFAALAHAALPPLPEQMPLDNAVAPYGLPPLPRAVADEVRNPFSAQATDDRMRSGDELAAWSDSAAQQDLAVRGEDAPRSEDVLRGEALAPGAALVRNEATARNDAARSEAAGDALEGPPVPLAPQARLTGRSVDALADGLPPDKPITLNFRHAELGAVLNAFAQFTGLNIIASDKARGAVTLHLDKVPWRVAFDTLLDVHGLAMERRGNVIWVAPLAELAARERQRFEAHARGADLEPLGSRTTRMRTKCASCWWARGPSACCPNAAPCWPIRARIWFSLPISTHVSPKSSSWSPRSTARPVR